MNVRDQLQNTLEALTMRVAQLEVTPEQLVQSPEVKRNTGVNAELGKIAFAGSVMESSYRQIENSTQVLLKIFEKHGEKIDINEYEIHIPDDQYLLVETERENFTVDVGNWTLNDTKLRKFPANKLRYVHGGAFGRHIDASLYAGGVDNTWVEIKNSHKLSLRKLPDGISLEEFLAPSLKFNTLP
jgi:hypothetical protein